MPCWVLLVMVLWVMMVPVLVVASMPMGLFCMVQWCM